MKQPAELDVAARWHRPDREQKGVGLGEGGKAQGLDAQEKIQPEFEVKLPLNLPCGQNPRDSAPSMLLL